jgi:hypothetical protein
VQFIDGKGLDDKAARDDETRDNDVDDIEKEGDQSNDIPSPVVIHILCIICAL